MTTDPKNTPRATGPAPSTSPPVSPRPKPFFCLDSILFGSRWALYPMNIGLMLALTVYLMRFFWQVGVLLFQSGPLIMEPGFDDHVLLGHIVGLLDQAMVCSLLIMTIMGGHQIYVRRFRDELTAAGPYWLKRVDTIVLKVKLGLAFTGVSSVVLLRDCISIETVPTNVWMAHVVIHVVFLGTTIITAIVWRIMHPEARKTEAQPPASPSVAAAPSQPPST